MKLSINQFSGRLAGIRLDTSLVYVFSPSPRAEWVKECVLETTQYNLYFIPLQVDLCTTLATRCMLDREASLVNPPREESEIFQKAKDFKNAKGDLAKW